MHPRSWPRRCPLRRGGGSAPAWAARLVRLQEPPWDHWLLVRRSIADPEDLAYFVVFGPATARLVDLARAAGRRWLVEECFEAAKQEVGLADYEVQSWRGWHRHITLAMLALALLAALRAGLNAAKGGIPPSARSSSPLSVPELRHLIAALALARAPPSPALTLAWSFWRRANGNGRGLAAAPVFGRWAGGSA